MLQKQDNVTNYVTVVMINVHFTELHSKCDQTWKWSMAHCECIAYSLPLSSVYGGGKTSMTIIICAIQRFDANLTVIKPHSDYFSYIYIYIYIYKHIKIKSIIT